MSGRIIIDTESFDRNNPTQSSSYGDDLHAADFVVTEMPGNASKKQLTALENDYEVEQDTPKVALTDEGRLICKSSVPGYSLKLKKWSMYCPFYT